MTEKIIAEVKKYKSEGKQVNIILSKAERFRLEYSPVEKARFDFYTNTTGIKVIVNKETYRNMVVTYE